MRPRGSSILTIWLQKWSRKALTINLTSSTLIQPTAQSIGPPIRRLATQQPTGTYYRWHLLPQASSYVYWIMYLLSPVQSPLSPRAIDTLALAGLTSAFVCCGQHSSLSPDGIYCVLCFNIHSVWVEINFSFAPNCLFAPAAQALQPWAPPFQQRRPAAGTHSCILYLITCVRSPRRQVYKALGNYSCWAAITGGVSPTGT